MTPKEEYKWLIKDVAGAVYQLSKRADLYKQRAATSKAADKKNNQQWEKEVLEQKRVALSILKSINYTYRRIEW